MIAPVPVHCFSITFDGSAYSTVLKQMPDITVYNGFIAVSAVSVIMVISILTPMTIGKLIQQRAIRRQLTAQDNSGGQPRITMKLTAVVVAYLTLISLPSITVSVTGLNGINIYDVRILHSGVIFAFLINHSTNFLLYNFFFCQEMTLVQAFGFLSDPGYFIFSAIICLYL